VGYLYLGAAIVGFVLLAASVFAGDHGSGGHDVGHDVGHNVGHDGHEGGSANSAASLALRLLSIRFWTYLLAFGGVTGLLLRRVAHTGEPTAAIAAGIVGLVAAIFARTVLACATQTTEPGTARPADFVGRVGGVLVPFAKGSTGKVRVRVKGNDVDLLARTEDGSPLERDEEVLIVEVREGAALVTRNPAPSDAR
jgi:membrane protein implicated in regulation of membrane protease activity